MTKNTLDFLKSIGTEEQLTSAESNLGLQHVFSVFMIKHFLKEMAFIQ